MRRAAAKGTADKGVAGGEGERKWKWRSVRQGGRQAAHVGGRRLQGGKCVEGRGVEVVLDRCLQAREETCV